MKLLLAATAAAAAVAGYGIAAAWSQPPMAGERIRVARVYHVPRTQQARDDGSAPQLTVDSLKGALSLSGFKLGAQFPIGQWQYKVTRLEIRAGRNAGEFVADFVIVPAQ